MPQKTKRVLNRKQRVSPDFIVEGDHESMSRKAARHIVQAVRANPGLLLCASAGGTPTRVYELLALEHRRDPRLFSRVRVLSIDEWAGLPASSPGRCVADLVKKLIQPLGVSSKRFISFQTAAPDLSLECARVADYLEKHGPIDICLLGLGTNGHMAMIEPANAFLPVPHVSPLAVSSLQHPLLADVEPKPELGMTIGMGDILRSREAILLVSGASKRQALENLLDCRVRTEFPASFLWLHPRATVYCDEAAWPSF